MDEVSKLSTYEQMPKFASGRDIFHSTVQASAVCIPRASMAVDKTHLLCVEAVLMMELPRRYSTPLEGGRFAPIKSSDYGGRPLTGPRPDDLSEIWLVEWSGLANE